MGFNVEKQQAIQSVRILAVKVVNITEKQNGRVDITSGYADGIDIKSGFYPRKRRNEDGRILCIKRHKEWKILL